MAAFKLGDVESLLGAFKNISSLPDDVKSDALTAMGDVAKQAQYESGKAKGVYDPKSTVHVIEKLKVKKPNITREGGSIEITIEGSRTVGNRSIRNAEIGFIQEFGAKNRNIPAKQWIKSANEQNADKINEAGAKIILDYIEKEFGGN